MKYIELPGLDRPVSTLIMGSDFFSPETIEHVDDVLQAYLDIGGNTIDTAYLYVGGKSEQAIGMWVQQHRNRDQINIWTKGAHPEKDGLPRVHHEAIEHDLLISLERLQTDYVDLYALHRDDPSVPVGEIMEALHAQYEAGRVRAIGVSNWTHERIESANAYAREHGLQPIVFSSPNLSLAKAKEPYWPGCVSADASTLAWHKQHRFPLFSWSAQARGFFTGRFTPEDRSNTDLVRVFYNDENWERYRRAEQLAKDKGVSTIQIALAYVLNQSFATAAIIGPQNREEMNSCAEGAKIVLSEQEVAWLNLEVEEG